MATTRLFVYKLPPSMNTTDSKAEIFRLLGLNVDHVDEQAANDSTVTLSVTLREPVELKTTTLAFRDQQLTVMPEITDDTTVTISRQWTDLLKYCKLNEIIVPGTRLMTSNGIITLQGKRDKVTESVERIQEAVVKRMAVACPTSRQEIDQNQKRSSADEDQQLMDKCGHRVRTVDNKGDYQMTTTNDECSVVEMRNDRSSQSYRVDQMSHSDRQSRTASILSDTHDAGTDAGSSKSEMPSNAAPGETARELDPSVENIEDVCPSSPTFLFPRDGKKDPAVDGVSAGLPVSSVDEDFGNSHVGHLSNQKNAVCKSSCSQNILTISEPLWAYIQFIDADAQWGSKFKVSPTGESKTDVELRGDHEDINRLRNFCDSGRLKRSFVTTKIPVSPGCSGIFLEQHVRSVASGKVPSVMVRLTDDDRHCQLLGKKSDVDRLYGFIADEFSESRTGALQSAECHHSSAAAMSTPSHSFPNGEHTASATEMFDEDDSKLIFFLTKSQVKVSLLTGDLFKQECKTIVCPCNRKMDHTGGLAGVIAHAAGDDLRTDCADFIRHRYRLEVSQAWYTRCGKIPHPVKWIIHACGPNQRDYENKNKCCGLLQMTFLNCLDVANKLSVISIGLPAISSGVYGVPIDVVAVAACKAIMSYDDSMSKLPFGSQCLKDIKFINIDVEVTQHMIRVFKELLMQPQGVGNVPDMNTKNPSDSRQLEFIMLQSLAVKNGFMVVDTPYDDNSVFGAIVDQLRRQGVTEHDVQSLRKQADECMKANIAPFKSFGGAIASGYRYVWHRVTGTPYDRSMLKAVASVIRRNIHVLNANASLAIFKSDEASGEPVVIGQTTGNHFVSLRHTGSANERSPKRNVLRDRDDTVITPYALDYLAPIAAAAFNDVKRHRDAHQKDCQRQPISEVDKLGLSFAHEPRGDDRTCNPDSDACPICMDGLDNPKKLQCGHVFCTDCIDTSFSYQKKCPCCGQIFGELKGNQPEGGTMQISYSGMDLEGFPGCGCIVVNYEIASGIQKSNHPNPGQPYRGARRTAYLPNNVEGREICALLQRAFDAGLIFTIGRSTTTGQDNVVTWNDIHHKTNFTGPFGYPDPTYLSRVRDELAAKGITSAPPTSDQQQRGEHLPAENRTFENNKRDRKLVHRSSSLTDGSSVTGRSHGDHLAQLSKSVVESRPASSSSGGTDASGAGGWFKKKITSILGSVLTTSTESNSLFYDEPGTACPGSRF